ncbi:hypothetical protein NDN08_000257 [Rhodosorus marinus]|uniref:GST N-terminal domain-containing protein n=1 Tax=Rhodosorus marinus TaxID=101924 RepID=A0AAV8UEQ4_9RHOD|nr:hypothetical protein NDN08_000257 [Rhodosorus marinus]
MAFLSVVSVNSRRQSVAAGCSASRRFAVRARAVGEDGGEEAGEIVEEQKSKNLDAIPTVPYPGPVAPKDFELPELKMLQPYPDMLVDTMMGAVGTLARAGTGLFVFGYYASIQDGKLVEESKSLPTARPELPLELYEFESCPFCRKVREALNILDLDCYVYPCPKDGQRFRPKLVEMGGKSMFPYLVDPNTTFAGYESDDIIKYLFETYADGTVPLALNAGAVTTISSGLASLARAAKGSKRASKVVYPEKPLTYWGYEPSPFCKVVRERLCEYEIPYLCKTTSRGSRKRAEMKENLGLFQVPYLEDPNTGLALFESKYILKYLDDVYGPNAENAFEELPADVALVKS